MSPLLPSNPVLALSGGRRSTSVSDATNWYATLSQEIEIAGQRGVRREAAAAAVDAQSKNVAIARRAAAAAALSAFYEASAAREEQRLADRLTVVTQAFAKAARARAERGLIAFVDADIADATSVRALQAKLAADRRATAGESELATLLGMDPAKGRLALDEDLRPLPGVEDAVGGAEVALVDRPEIAALASRGRELERRAAAFRRSRISNPTLSAFVQNDGFNERVFGLGVAIPIPLPGNVGRTNVGEIAEAEALAHRATTERARAEREIHLALVVARQAFASRRREVEAFTAERLSRAETSLVSIGQEVEAGRLAVRDAVVAQQALIELLRAGIEARRDWCLASVDLARAAGTPLEGRTP